MISCDNIGLYQMNNPHMWCVCRYIYSYDIDWYHSTPLDYYLTPPWGVSTNQGKDIRAYVKGFDFDFSSANLNSPLNPSKMQEIMNLLCKVPIKWENFAKIMNSWSCVGEFWFSMKYVQPLCAGLRYDLFVFKIRPTTYCHHQMVGWW